MLSQSDLQQGSNEWHALRATRIGSSDAASIMGKSPWDTPLSLWRKKVGLEAPHQTDAMRRGTMLEEQARHCFIRMTGIPMEPEVYYNDWQIASLDGVNKERQVILEIKCPNAETHTMAMKGIIPEYYMIQMQHQFAVTGFKTGYYFSFDGEKGVIVDVQRDDELIAKLTSMEKEFYQRMVDFNPPESPYKYRNDDAWHQAAEQLIHAKEAKERAEKEEEEARKRLIALADADKTEGFGVRLSRIIAKGTVQYKKIPQLQGIDLEMFRASPTERWTINLI